MQGVADDLGHATGGQEALARLEAGRRIDRPLGALVLADAAETWRCRLLALGALGGLLAYTIAGWWWADPAAGFVIACCALRAGAEAWRGDGGG